MTEAYRRGELSDSDRKRVLDTARALTGKKLEKEHCLAVLFSRVHGRMREQGFSELQHYLDFVSRSEAEKNQLVSCITINTTSWFRESKHFEWLMTQVAQLKPGSTIRILSLPCSTGEEVYTIGLCLESVLAKQPGQFNYEIVGFDIDTNALAEAHRALYRNVGLAQIPPQYRRFLLSGSGKSEGLFTIDKRIRSRVRFVQGNLLQVPHAKKPKYDYIFCRNLLIYLSQKDIERGIRSLVTYLNPAGHLLLGHSEHIEERKFKLERVHNATYLKPKRQEPKRGVEKRKVLSVDDSPMILKMLARIFERENFEVLSAQSTAEADEVLQRESVDIITLDVLMPEVLGSDWLEEKRSKGLKTPVLLVSGCSEDRANGILSALDKGAQDYIDKQDLNPAKVFERVDALLAKSTRSLTEPKLKVSKRKRKGLPRPDIILCGASTGGTEALMKVFSKFPANSPPILVVQHLPPAFLKPFAERLAQNAGLTLGGMRNGEPLQTGHIYTAVGDYHIAVRDQEGGPTLKLSEAPPVCRHRPSVDYLFESGALLDKLQVSAALLTGMGADGAAGMKKLSEKGAFTSCQDENSCVVFGMPKAAIEMTDIDFVGDLTAIRAQLLSSISKGS